MPSELIPPPSSTAAIAALAGIAAVLLADRPAVKNRPVPVPVPARNHDAPAPADRPAAGRPRGGSHVAHRVVGGAEAPGGSAGAGRREPGGRRRRAGGADRFPRRRAIDPAGGGRDGPGPDAGELELDGRRTSGLQVGSLPYVRRNIGYLPADPPLRARRDRAGKRDAGAGRARPVARARPRRPPGRRWRRWASTALAERRPPACRCPSGAWWAPPAPWWARRRSSCSTTPSPGLDEQDRDRLMHALAEPARAGSAILCGTSDAALAAPWAARGPPPAPGRRPHRRGQPPCGWWIPKPGTPSPLPPAINDDDHQAAAATGGGWAPSPVGRARRPVSPRWLLRRVSRRLRRDCARLPPAVAGLRGHRRPGPAAHTLSAAERARRRPPGGRSPPGRLPG